MKTFYSYDTNDNKMMIKIQLALIILSSVGILVSSIYVILTLLSPSARQHLLMNALILGACLLILMGALPARKRYINRVKNETLIAHDWGIEHIDGEFKKEARWNEIIKIDTIDRSFIVFKLKEYIVRISQADPIRFTSSLENSDFLVNYIHKNLKKTDAVDLKWQK